MISDLISIAVPIYNVEKYLKDCINSIINQTYKNLEIILVNDGSTDSSLDICKTFQMDNRIKIIDKKNEGLSIARQTAIDIATGDYICMIDSDDFIEKDYIENLYTNIKYWNSDISICATSHFTESNVFIYGFSNSVSSFKEILKHDIECNYVNMLGLYYMADSWAKMYSLSYIRKSRIQFTLPKTYNGTDSLFNYLLMLSMPKISIIHEVLYNHRIHSNSRVHRKDKKMQEGFQIIMNTILCESEKYNFSNTINKQFALIYTNLMIVAGQDIVNSANSYKETKDILKTYHINNRLYLSGKDSLKFSFSIKYSVITNVFNALLKYNSLILLYHFFKLRQYKINRIKRKTINS